MKIAFIVPYVPNKIRTRSYNLIHQLSELGHEVVLFTLGSSEADHADAEHLKTLCKQVYYHAQPTWRSLMNCVLALPSRRPLQSVYSWNPEFAGHMRDLIESETGVGGVDVIHVEHLRGSEYGVFLNSAFPSIPMVWDSVDCISYLFEQAASHSGSMFGRIITRFELGRTRWAEGNLLDRFDRVLVTSATDRNALIELSPVKKQNAPVSVLPNGVDLDYFRPNESFRPDDATIVFSGKMSYHANISMVKYLVGEIMPRVWEQRSDAQLVIVGKDPPPEIRTLSSNPLVTVTGTVDDIRPFLWRAALAVVPLVYGAGIQNKILEAMATGTPVITTSKAISSLQVLPDRDIVVADTPAEFSDAILRLMANKDLRTKVAKMGLDYVKRCHDWRAVAEQLVNEYQGLMPAQKMSKSRQDMYE